MAKRKHTRRTEEQLIADLEAKIEGLKRRAAEKVAKKDPTLRHVSKAIRSIDAATAETKDAAFRTALEEARATLSACLQLQGVVVPGMTPAGGSLDPDAVLSYVKSNPGRRGEEIAAELGTDTKTLRGPMKRLIEAGRVRTKGERRGMQYFAK